MSLKRVKASDAVLDYKVHVSQFYENYYLDPSESDITLLIEGRKIPAHRLIISAESRYFKALLYGDFAERNQREIAIQEVSYPAFLLILQYMYSKVLDLADKDLVVLLNALELAGRFGLEQLAEGFGNYLSSIICVENVFQIYHVAKLLSRTLFEGVCAFIDRNQEKVLTLDEFLTLESTEIYEILSRKREKISEAKVFQIIQNWMKQNPANSDILKCLDFARLSIAEIRQEVQPSKLFDDSFLLEILQSKGFEIKAVTNCENPENFLTVENNFTEAIELFTVDDETVFGFLVELADQNFINRIEMKVDGSGYKIEVSTDQEEWIEVIDFWNDYCDGLQDLYFPMLETKFIRVTWEMSFLCNSFKVFKSAEVPNMKEGFLCPKGNEDTHAVVFDMNLISSIEKGQLKSLWNKFEENGLQTPSVVHPCIIFNQPHYVNTIRFRLWDYDGRKQSFILNVTKTFDVPDQIDSKDDVDGWQQITFPSMAINRIYFDDLGSRGETLIAFLEVFYDENLEV